MIRKGISIAKTPICTEDLNSLSVNALSALRLLHCGRGIQLDENQQQFITCLNFTSTQQAAQFFLHTELQRHSSFISHLPVSENFSYEYTFN